MLTILSSAALLYNYSDNFFYYFTVRLFRPENKRLLTVLTYLRVLTVIFLNVLRKNARGFNNPYFESTEVSFDCRTATIQYAVVKAFFDLLRKKVILCIIRRK